MGKISDKELQEFWLWCGFRYERRERRNSHWHCWISPDGSEEMTYPPIDLNSLFKYAVSKVVEDYGLAVVRLELLASIFKAIKEDEDPALALYQAIQGVRGREE